MQYTTCKPLNIENNSIIAIEETSIYDKSLSGNAFVYASKKPKAVVILSDVGIKAYDLKFNEIPVEKLIEETEGLKDLIESNC